MVLDKFSLKGKVAAVTGGGQGSGAATAQALGEAGAAVAILDLDPARAEASAGRLRDRGIAAEGLPLDVTSSRDVDRVAAELERRHGRVDVLVNNAGIAISEVPAPVSRINSNGPCSFTSTGTRISGCAPPASRKRTVALFVGSDWGVIIS